jgi:Domain of unknown function (DUF4296)
MRWYVAIVSLLLVLVACSKNERTPDILAEEKMRAIMQDLIRADEYVADFVLKDSTKHKKQESIRLYEEVFRIHRVTGAQFRKSLDYYTSRPDRFQPIVDSLMVRKTEFIAPTIHPVAQDTAPRPFFEKRLRKKKRLLP